MALERLDALIGFRILLFNITFMIYYLFPALVVKNPEEGHPKKKKFVKNVFKEIDITKSQIKKGGMEDLWRKAAMNKKNRTNAKYLRY